MKRLKLYFLAPLFWSSLYSATIGSDTAVTRFNNVVTINDGDRIAGFAALAGGLTFASADVVAIFDSFFPVSGIFSLTGGSLALFEDLYLRNNLDFQFLGNIYGNNHKLVLPVTDRIPSACGTALNCAPFFITSISIGANDAETLGWDYSETYLATADDGGVVSVYSFNGSTLTFAASIATGALAAADGVGQIAWRPGQRMLGFARQLGAAATDEVYTFSFNVNTNTITTISSTNLTADGRACAWHPSGNFLAVGSLVTTGEVIIYPVNAAGSLNVAGSVSFNVTPDRAVYYECIDWDPTGTYLAVGLVTDGVNPELIVLTVNTGTLSITGINASVFIGKTVTGLDWGNPYLAIGLEGTTGDNIRIYSHSGNGGGVGAGSLTLLDSTSDLGRTTEGISWAGDGLCFSASTDELGGTAFFNTYSFENQNLTLVTNFVFTGLAAGDDFEATRWGPQGAYSAVSGDNNIISVYGLPNEACFTFANLNIVHSSNTLFHDCCITFTGSNIWDGAGNSLELAPTCTLYVGANSQLMLKDMTLFGLQTDRISLLDSTSTLTLNNTDIVLSGDYQFNKGRLDILNNVSIAGNGYSMIFTSSTAAHINATSQLMFDKNTTFSYNPNNNSRTLFSLDSSTSQLAFYTATLATAQSGLQLTNGKLIFDGLCSLINTGTSVTNALEFGNGTLANNLFIEITPASVVQLTQGQLSYNNV